MYSVLLPFVPELQAEYVFYIQNLRPLSVMDVELIFYIPIGSLDDTVMGVSPFIGLRSSPAPF